MKKFVRYIKKRWFLWLLMLAAGWVIWSLRYDIAYRIRPWIGIELPENPRPIGVSKLEWCEHNYRDEMADISSQLNISYEYLMALAVLECSGDKPAGHRFEKKVFNELKKVRDGKRERYEDITQSDLAEMSDEGLRNLATSWGPFQLMGYKVIPMGIKIKNIRDERNAAVYGAQWIKDEYGGFLEKKQWQDAFHYHNTGRRFPLSGKPQTHNPYYVSNGMRYMKYFEKNSPFPAIKESTRRYE